MFMCNRSTYVTLFVCVVFFSFMVVGCGSSGGTDANADDVGGTATVHYAGTLSTTMDYYDYEFSGNRSFLFTRDYTQPVSVTIASPKTVSANVYHDPNVPSTVKESNPFNVQVDTVNQGEEGNLGIASALLFYAMSGGELLEQYWTFTANGQQINGSLTDTHISESQAANILWAWDEAIPGIPGVYPFYMAVGATIQGTVTSQAVELQFNGASTDGLRVFQAIISAGVSP